MDEEKDVDGANLKFCTAFDTISHGILLEKLATHRLDRRALDWVKNWLNGQAELVMVNGVTFSW